VATAPASVSEDFANQTLTQLRQQYDDVRRDRSLTVRTLETAAALARRYPRHSDESLFWYRAAVDVGQSALANGVTLDAAHVDLLGEAEFADLELEFDSVWPEEAQGKCPASTIFDFFGSTEDAGATGHPGAVWSILDRAVKLEHVLGATKNRELRASKWVPMVFARWGLMRSHLAQSIALCTELTTDLFTNEEHLELDRLVAQGQSATVAARVHARRAVFLTKRSGWLEDERRSAVRLLALGVSAARAYGVSHALLSDASTALRVLHQDLSEPKFMAVLAETEDLMDPRPSGKRRLSELSFEW
jgi:hypothetical protein